MANYIDKINVDGTSYDINNLTYGNKINSTNVANNIPYTTLTGTNNYGTFNIAMLGKNLVYDCMPRYYAYSLTTNSSSRVKANGTSISLSTLDSGFTSGSAKMNWFSGIYQSYLHFNAITGVVCGYSLTSDPLLAANVLFYIPNCTITEGTYYFNIPMIILGPRDSAGNLKDVTAYKQAIESTASSAVQGYDSTSLACYLTVANSTGTVYAMCNPPASVLYNYVFKLFLNIIIG